MFELHPAVFRRLQAIDETLPLHQYGSGVEFGIVDSGINAARHPHEFSAERLLSFDSVVPRSPVTDCVGHGTAVCSLIGGASLGISKNCQLRVVKCYDNATDDVPMRAVTKAVALALSYGIHVLNISLGSQMPQPTLRRLCRDAAASGVLIVAAAGNDSAPNLQEPARFDSVLSVGAVDYLGSRMPFSSYDSRRSKLDLVDYGENVLVAGLDSTLRVVSGTSYAAAQVSGILGLMVAARRRVGGKSLTVSQVREMLPQITTRCENSDRSQVGHGRLDIAKAIAWAATEE